MATRIAVQLLVTALALVSSTYGVVAQSGHLTLYYQPYTYPHPLNTASVPACSGGATTAAGITQEQVQAALDAAATNGSSVVCIPDGTVTVTTTLTAMKGMTLRPVNLCTLDVTGLPTSCPTTFSGSGADILQVNIPAANIAAFRLTNFAFTGTNLTAAVWLDGSFTTTRVDHVRVTKGSDTTHVLDVGHATWYTNAPAVQPLIDHVSHTASVCGTAISPYGRNDAWLSTNTFGTSNAIFLEDSKFNYSVSSLTISSDCDVIDLDYGARAVVRQNTFTNGMVLTHDLGALAQSRGMRNMEVYANTFVCLLTSGFDCGNSPLGFRGGTWLAYNNSLPICQDSCTTAPKGWEHSNSWQIARLDVGFVPTAPWNFNCTNTQLKVCSDFRSHCSGGTHPACGAFESPGQACDVVNTCGGSGCGICTNNPGADTDCGGSLVMLPYIDGTSTTGGYPCRDQTGRGKDWVNHLSQDVEPVYWWNNTDPNTGGSQLTSPNVAATDMDYIRPNREVFLTDSLHCAAGSASCTAGVGQGTYGQLPGTCSNADFPGFPGPAYWVATDPNPAVVGLYVCK